MSLLLLVRDRIDLLPLHGEPVLWSVLIDDLVEGCLLGHGCPAERDDALLLLAHQLVLFLLQGVLWELLMELHEAQELLVVPNGLAEA